MYVLGGNEYEFMFALTDPDMVLFVDKYFRGQLREDVVDLVTRDSMLEAHYRDTIYLENLSKNRIYKKGCFKRVKRV